MSIDELVHLIRPSAGEAAGLLVLMHGRGVDESDLFGLADLFDPERQLVVAAPRAPLRLPGSPGYHWYVVERVGFPHPKTFHATYELLDRWVGALGPEVGVAPERTVLAGFSQGAVMSYALGLGLGRPVPAGIVALSGFVPTVEGWEPDLDSRAGLPVYIAHGTNDQIISVEFAREARELLEGQVAVTYREHPGGHGIDPRSFDEIREWLGTALAPPAD